MNDKCTHLRNTAIDNIHGSSIFDYQNLNYIYKVNGNSKYAHYKNICLKNVSFV